MADHAGRAHATWSASSTDRFWNCAGALILTADLPETEGEAAAWGTACHEVSEMCLRESRDAVEYIDRVIKTKHHAIVVDEEMAETAQTYVDYVREQAGYGILPLFVEEKFSLAKLNPPFDAGGTADAIVFHEDDKLLEVIDLKGGRGVVVEAKGNPQLRTYALGAMLRFPGLDVTHVKVTIVQPRAGHKDGRIRSETFHVADLAEWTSDLLVAMRRAAQAAADYEKITGDVSREEWATKHLNAGSHCKFCKATATCPAREKKAMDAAAVWFDDLDKPHIANTPDKLDPEQLSKTLDLLDMIEDWIGAVRALAHTQAEMGAEIPNYILVDKEGREKWKDDGAVKAALEAKNAPISAYLNPAKLRTPKQTRDALKKAGADDALAAITGLSETPKTGTNLVRADKTSRKPAESKPQRFFSVLD